MDSIQKITGDLAGLMARVDQLRRRTLALALLRAGGAALWIWLITLLLFGAAALLWPLPLPARLALLLLHLALLVGGTLHGAGRHVLGNRDVRAWALRCEELCPKLDKQLVTCIDLARAEGAETTFLTSPVAGALLADTVAKMAWFDPRLLIPARRLSRPAIAIALAIAFLGLLCAVAPEGLMGDLCRGLYCYNVPRGSLGIPLAPESEPLELSVHPGDCAVPRGASVPVEAVLKCSGPDAPKKAPILNLMESEGQPAAHSMILDQATSVSAAATYKLALHDVRRSVRYQVAAGRLQSKIYRIEPYDPPKVESVRSRLKPPDYLRRPERELTGFSITGLTSSALTVLVRSDHPLRAARLAGEKDTELTGSITGREARFTTVLKKNTAWRVELTDSEGHPNVDPPLLQIRVTPDEPPTIKITRPGGDWAVHAVGEITLEAQAEDDYGVQAVTLEWRLNGGPLTTQTLYAAPAAPAAPPLKQAVTHTLELESLKLKPGDSITYRLHADDGQPDPARRLAHSQPYFVMIRPFTQDFYKGGPGNGGGLPMPGQRQVIVATTRLLDPPREWSAEVLGGQFANVSRVQRELNVMTQRLRQKMQLATDLPNLAERLAHLDAAIVDMKNAESLLDRHGAALALAPENSALSHQAAAFEGLPLLMMWNADKMNSPFASDPRTDLLGQRVSAKKDRYELMDPAQAGGQVDRKLAEAFEKVRALARRQMEFTETIRREKQETEDGGGQGRGQGKSRKAQPKQQSSPKKASPSTPPQSDDSGPRLEKMLSENEESRRQLERLRDELAELKAADPQLLKELQQAMEDAARELAQVDGALRARDLQQAAGANARTLDRLQELELKLGGARQAAGQEALERLAQQAGQWERREEELKQSAGKLAGQSSGGQEAQRRQLGAEQEQLAGELKDAIGRMNKENGSGGKERAKLEQALDELGKASDLMRQAARGLGERDDRAAAKGQQAALDRLAKAREALAAGLAGQRDPDSLEQLAQALDQVRAMRELLAAGAPHKGQSGADQGKPEGEGKQAIGNKKENTATPQGKAGEGRGKAKGQGREETEKTAPEEALGQGRTQTSSDVPAQRGGPPREARREPAGGGEADASGPPQYRQAGGEQEESPARPQATGRPQAATRAATVIAPEAVLIHLTELRRIVPRAPALEPLLRPLLDLGHQLQTVNYTPAQRIEIFGRIETQLGRIEALLKAQLSVADQLQRLEQTPDSQLPANFREMAARYFELLSKSE